LAVKYKIQNSAIEMMKPAFSLNEIEWKLDFSFYLESSSLLNFRTMSTIIK
jgi:hypothetical protein